MLWALLIACQEPFGADRHDLVGNRIAAIEIEATGAPGVITARIAVVSDGRPWADELPELRWTWLDAPEALADLGEGDAFDASGPRPLLHPRDDLPVLGLWARWPGGEHRAFVDLGTVDATATLPRPQISAQTLPLAIDDVQARALDLEARRGLQPTSEELAPGGFARVSADGVDEATVRWMATGGTFFELDDRRTDWAAGTLVVDGDEVEERATWGPGVATVLALALFDDGARFSARDLRVAVDEPGVFVGGRWLPGLALEQSAWVQLQADDAAPSGVRVGSLAEAPALVEPLPCPEPARGPLNLDWLLTLQCRRGDLLGGPVLVEPDP